MSTTSTTESHRLVGLVLGLTTLLAVLLTAFAWPTSELEPRGLPVVVSGPAEATAGLSRQLGATAGTDAFDVTPVADRGAAVEAIEQRDAYAGFVLTPDGTEVLVATAAGPVVAQQLTQLATEASAGAPAPPVVTDVVPAPDDDPRGAVFGAGALPLVLGGMLVGIATSVLLASSRARIAVAAAVAAVGGLALTGILQGWLGALEGSYLANAGVVALGLAAMSFTIIGLRQLLGPAGIGLGAALVLLVGNPLSGISSAPELLPLGWLGQLLPPGAVGSALRSTAFFDGAGAGVPLLVLACWAVAGLVLALVSRRSTEAGAVEQAPEAQLTR